jgi:hypothetical protein
MSSRSAFAATCDELAMTSVSVPRIMSATPKSIAAAILAVRNLIMPDVPALLNAFVIGKARTRAGTTTIVL